MKEFPTASEVLQSTFENLEQIYLLSQLVTQVVVLQDCTTDC